MTVHSELGHGFLESVYEEALAIIFTERNIPFEQQKNIRISFREQVLKKIFIADLIVDDKIIIEIKAVASLNNAHEAQMINYLKATGIKVGLLLNFGGPRLEWKRFVF